MADPQNAPAPRKDEPHEHEREHLDNNDMTLFDDSEGDRSEEDWEKKRGNEY